MAQVGRLAESSPFKSVICGQAILSAETADNHFGLFEAALKPGASLAAVRAVIGVTFEAM